MIYQTRLTKVVGWTGAILYCVSFFITMSAVFGLLTNSISTTITIWSISMGMLAVSSYMVNWALTKNVRKVKPKEDEQ